MYPQFFGCWRIWAQNGVFQHRSSENPSFCSLVAGLKPSVIKLEILKKNPDQTKCSLLRYEVHDSAHYSTYVCSYKKYSSTFLPRQGMAAMFWTFLTRWWTILDKCKYFNGTLTVQHMAGIHSNPEPLHSAGLSYHYLPSNSRSWVRLGLMLVGLLRWCDFGQNLKILVGFRLPGTSSVSKCIS